MNIEKPGFAILETQRRTENQNNTFIFSEPLRILQFSIDNFPGWELLDELKKQGVLLCVFSYELKIFNEDVSYRKNKLIDFPDVWIGVYKDVKRVEGPINWNVSGWAELVPDEADTDKEEYVKKVEKIRDYIYRGDVYQINFTIRQGYRFHGEPAALYSRMKKAQRVPYGAFINLGAGKFVISNSPELFFRVSGQEIETKPMKGTRASDNKENVRELFFSTKDRAENVMIVDLMRNDLGRICEFGSVEVKRLHQIEKYDTVFQMTSTIKGRLRDGTKPSHIFSALYPAGSITGAPKKRAMQIIYELENTPRQLYTGAIGIIMDEFMEFNVAIRTVMLDTLNARAVYGSGGGIVFDSAPEKEYDEMVLKTKVLAELCKK